jgi:pSer/pThr/pTyr-binding forkhead associated (FHA) protein
MERSSASSGSLRAGDSRAGRFRLLYRGEELVLEPGQYFIGRSPKLEIVVDDPLVSRRHARILANETTVVLEDLRSENGVFVNEERIRRSVRLGDGDRILIGHQELSFRVLPPSVMAKLWSGQMPSVPAPPPLVAIEPTSKDGVTTLETDAFEYLGRVADKMLTMGRAKTAERVLSAHLWDVLQAARRGDNVERAVIDAATTAAIKLAAELRDPGWVHFVLELHVIYALPICAPAAQVLKRIAPHLPGINRSLFHGYQRALMASVAKLSPEDVALSQLVLEMSLG